MNDNDGEAKGEFAAVNSSTPTKSGQRLSILVVEDEAIVAQDVCEFLQELQHRVVGVAASGREALQLAQRWRPDLIVMDVRLHDDMDGIQTASAILAQNDIPIIFLTGQTDTQTLERAVRAGTSAYLVKPFKEAELRGAIEIAMTKHQAEVARRARENDLRRNAEELQHLSLVDELTGLKNRRGFFALAEQELKVAHREQQAIVLFFVDLNGLKGINDEYGHASGDLALRDAAAVLTQTFRESDILARLGGDEFVALTRSPDNDVIYAVKRRLREHLARYNVDSGRPFALDMSIGAATVQDITTDSIDAIVARADAAMYEDKRTRRTTSVFRVR